MARKACDGVRDETMVRIRQKNGENRRVIQSYDNMRTLYNKMTQSEDKFQFGIRCSGQDTCTEQSNKL